MIPLAFLGGQFLPQAAAHLPLHDAGFVLGATVTDLCRTFHQRLYLWPRHLARFARSCQAIDVALPLSEDDISVRAEELLAHNCRLLPPGQELALVLFATPGPIGYYLGEPGAAGDGPVTFGMHTYPLPWARLSGIVRQGVSLRVPTIRQVPGDAVDPHIKQRSRMHWWLADRAVRREEPGATALLLDRDGHVTETAAANFVMVRQGRVVSPPRADILEGISLEVIRELCGELGVPWIEEPLTLDDCLAADEALLTNTSFCLAGVCRLQGKPMTFPGPMLGRLLRAWNDRVGLDIHGQIVESGRER